MGNPAAVFHIPLPPKEKQGTASLLLPFDDYRRRKGGPFLLPRNFTPGGGGGGGGGGLFPSNIPPDKESVVHDW